jgi:hypothetical protein
VQLVFVLLDRSLLYLTRLMNWAHARRDREAFLASLGDAPGFVSAWPEAKRKVVVDWFAAVRGSGKVDRTKATQALRALLRDVLATHSGGDKA